MCRVLKVGVHCTCRDPRYIRIHILYMYELQSILTMEGGHRGRLSQFSIVPNRFPNSSPFPLILLEILSLIHAHTLYDALIFGVSHLTLGLGFRVSGFRCLGVPSAGPFPKSEI